MCQRAELARRVQRLSGRTRLRSDEARAHWATEAEELVVELQSALEGKAELDVDLWPLRSR